MAYNFSNIPPVRCPRSNFSRNHNIKTTINTDYLYPIYVDEALPGDVFKFNSELFGRLTTPITPLMDNLYLDFFFFAIPVRLVDKDFKKLMGERPFGDVSNDYLVPQMRVSPKSGSLSDYLGLPLMADGHYLDVCPWWHRAYNLVYNEWFRDENLCPAVPVAGVHEDGTVSDEVEADYVLLKRGKRKDYFTSALPWPQKGPQSTFGSDKRAGYATFGDFVSPKFYFDGYNDSEGFKIPLAAYNPALSTNTSNFKGLHFVREDGKAFGEGATPPATGTAPLRISLPGAVPVSFEGVSAVTVNELRESIAIQHLLETDARGGTRYVELIRSHFGIVSPDARLQRPEYLGGCSQPLNWTSVAQTSATTQQSPQGNLASFSTVHPRCRWIKTFTEHSIVIGLCNLRADLSYQQGLPRMFSRKTKFDFYWPELANLGEQPILNKEIYAQGYTLDSEGNPVPNATDDGIFGYQERWAEYRYHPNQITGLFRSTAATNLDYWHLAQKFDNLPKLNCEFINESVPIDRVLAVATSVAPNLILDGWFKIDCARLMPLYSVPGLSKL